MPTIEQLKEIIDCNDLADKLDWKRPGGRGNYSAPNRDDKTPSVEIDKNGRWFKDYTGAGKGSCVDMVLYHYQMEDVGEAVKILHELYHLPLDRPKQEEKREQSIVEYIASKCRGNDDQVLAYLGGRGIDAGVCTHAIKKGTLGFSTYTNPKFQPGENYYAGPAVAFITKSFNPGHVVGVDTRYVDPDLNGGRKTGSQGDKNVPWTSDLYRLKHAKTVYWFESPINALSMETCGFARRFAAVATKGTEVVKDIDLHFMLGKSAVICMDNDETNDDGKCPGPEAAWVLYERLTALGVACQLVDQIEWKKTCEDYNDANDVLQGEGAARLKTWLSKFESWCIAGLPGNTFEGRKRRIYLPPHDFSQYWKFRHREDFTSWVKEMKPNDAGEDTEVMTDLCGFRIASLNRVSIAGATSVMSGDDDTQATTLFSVSVQTPRHGSTLVKRVFEDEQLHNLTHWNKFGPIFLPQQFNRLVNILERGAHLGARDAINFVGVAWKQGKLVVNEGRDSFFTEPNKQCPYHNLVFPSGQPSDARRVIDAYQATFKDNAAMMILAWGLGGHLKAILGFWPHMIIQAEKGSGKSVLTGKLQSTIGFQMFSGQSLQTEYRLLTTCSHTSQPVGWEEISARGQQIIDKAVSLLQEAYQYTVTRRGDKLLEFMISAPVLLAGEDVPVKSLTGKTVRAELSGKKGALLPDNLPKFPVREWLDYLVAQDVQHVKEIFARALQYVTAHCRSSMEDSGADRMRQNYAAVLTGWRLMCDFAGLSTEHGDFKRDILAEMNNHIAETTNDRDPWIWIIEILLDEISAQRYVYPFKFIRDNSEGLPVDCLAVRHKHIMAQLSGSMALRDTYNALPIKSSGVLLKQLVRAGVVYRDRVDVTINNRRESHMIALNLDKLAEYGIYVSLPDNVDNMPSALHVVHDETPN